MRGLVLNINPYNKTHRFRIDGKMVVMQWDDVKRHCPYMKVGDEFTIEGNKFLVDCEIVEPDVNPKACVMSKEMVVYDPLMELTDAHT